MKKILILILFLIFGWAGSTWFIGNETESLLKTYMQNTKNASAEMGMKTNYEIKDYKKSFLKSTAKTVMSLNTGDPVIDELFGEFQFNHTISHGPVLLANGSPRFGTAHIYSALDVSSLKPETQVIIKKFFADKSPLTGNIIFGLNELADYDVSVPAIEVKDAESLFSLKEGLHLTGVINKTTLMGTANGTIGALNIVDDGLTIKASASTVNVDMQGMVAGQMVGTSHFTTPSINITGAEVPPVSFGFDFLSDTRKSGDVALEGDIKITASNIEAPIEVSDIKFSTSFKAFQIKGLEQLAAIQKDVQELQSSAMSDSMSANEQEKLMEKLQNLPNIMVAAVQNTLQKDQTSLQIKADIASKQGPSLLDIDMRYIGNGADINLEALMAGGLASMQKIVTAKMDVNVPKALITSTPAAFFLPSLIEQGVVAENSDSFSLKVALKTDEIDLNGKSMSADEFSSLMETLGFGGGENNELPVDADMPIGGLPPELLESLSKQSAEALEAQGVPKEIIEQMKEMNQEKAE